MAAASARSRIKRLSFDGWSGQLDEALRVIPEDADYPHELIKGLAQQLTGQKKKTWLALKDGEPIAVAPLKKAGMFSWTPVSHYILPGIVVPAMKGQLFEALASLGLHLNIALWRTDCGLPEGPCVRRVTQMATYGMDCSEDFEAFWKETSMWRNLRKARNKWKQVTLKENAPGAAEWLIKSWGRKWGVSEDELCDRVAVAAFLEKMGKHFSLTLCDGDKPIAGATCVIHRGEVVAQCLYRDNDDSNIGNRLVHMFFCWAQERGFSAVDIGGGHDYKRKYAPPRGERHEVTISPIMHHVGDRAWYEAKHKLRRLIKTKARSPVE